MIIRLIGGPADGRTFEVPGDTPPFAYLVAEEPPLADLWAMPLDVPKPIRKAEYEPVLLQGHPSRADDGAYLYRHRRAPLTPEARRAVTDARCASQAEHEARDAELDAAWGEIRKVRPLYPDDWRDL